jgi:hypothetical protein
MHSKTTGLLFCAAAALLADGAHHYEAVPKTATAHQVRGNPSGRFFSETADLKDRIA